MGSEVYIELYSCSGQLELELCSGAAVHIFMWQFVTEACTALRHSNRSTQAAAVTFLFSCTDKSRPTQALSCRELPLVHWTVLRV